MNIVKRTIGAVALAAVAVVGYGDGVGAADDAAEVIAGAGAIAQGALDLSDVWDKRDFSDEPILWSSLGWEDAAEAEGGKTVTLQLVSSSGDDPQTLASGLKGHRQTYVWTPDGVANLVYDLKHIVVGGSPLETLNACFSFENAARVAPSEADVRAAIGSDDGTGLTYGIANDTGNWWTTVGGPGEGIVAPEGKSSFKITVEGSGHLRFDYALGGGAWTVKVDGIEVRTMDAADWTVAEVSVDGALAAHVIEFVTNLSDGDTAALKNVRWVDTDDCFGAGRCGIGAVDLREGVLVVRRANELMPFAWSSTNFTGVIEIGLGETQRIDPQSVASVRVVQVTGAGDDVSLWTTELDDTAKTLVTELQGEGTVKWKGVKAGVWKAELVIETGGIETYRETRILDLRNYAGPGLLLFVM